MDSFDVKLEKANAVSSYRRLQKFTLVFRLVEFFVFLFMISKMSSQIMMPFAFKFSVEYFQGLYSAVFSTRFVFLLGNAIIVVLFIKSGQLSPAGGDNSSNSKLDFYDEYVKSCTQRSETVINKDHEEIRKNMYRSRSENSIVRENHEEIRLTHRKLKRSLTSEITSGRKNEEEKKSCCAAEDELSGEEFRRTVEAFIARQQKSLRDEEFAPIVYIGP